MKAVAIAGVILMALLTVGAIAFWYLVPIQMDFVDDPALRQSTNVEAIEQSAPEGPAETEEIMTEDDWKSFELRWANAPEEIVAIARMIAEGDVPEGRELEALGAEALSRGYPAPQLDFTRDDKPVAYLSTLLQEASLAYNSPAAQALIDAGANPDANHGEALYIAVGLKTPGAPRFMIFPDFDESLPLLRVYLEAGADPDPRRHGFIATTPFEMAYGERNLGAMLVLLEFGADPWLDLPGPSGHKIGSYIEQMAASSGGTVSAETLFRIGRSGHLPYGPDEAVQGMFAELSSVAEKFASGTGPESRHTAWRLDQALQVLGEALDRKDEADTIRARLTTFDYEADGGWYLAEDEIHSRYDAPLSAPDKGSETWGP